MENKCSLTFVIPALNEEEHIGRTIASIEKYCPEKISYEIIVCDNGSVDSTKEIAKNHGAKVISDEVATIGGLRNIGAREAKGFVLVFLDADIQITAKWSMEIISVLESLRINGAVVTGSKCGIGNPSSWLEKIWFEPQVLSQSVGNKYINSGHLIVTKEYFNKIGGFDENLSTGEDYEFGRRASRRGAEIKNNLCLQVIHTGYPKSILRFFVRELWHGTGDFQSLGAFMGSKVAQVSIFILALSVLSLYLFFVGEGLLGAVGIFIIGVISMLSYSIKYHVRSIKKIVLGGGVFYLYYLGRALSPVKMLVDKIKGDAGK